MREAALFFLKAKTPTKKPKNPPQNPHTKSALRVNRNMKR